MGETTYLATIHNIMNTITQYLNGVYVGSIVCMKLYIIVYIISYQYHIWHCIVDDAAHSVSLANAHVQNLATRGHRVCLKIGYP